MSKEDRRQLLTIEDKVINDAKSMFFALSQNFVTMAQHTQAFVQLYEDEAARCTNVADELVQSTTEMIRKCEELDTNLETLEQLAAQASLMRKVAVELEKKLDRVLR